MGEKEESVCLIVAVSNGGDGGQILLMKDNQFYNIAEVEEREREGEEEREGEGGREGGKNVFIDTNRCFCS